MSHVVPMVVRVHISIPDLGPVSWSMGGWEYPGPGVSLDAAVCYKNACSVNSGMRSDPKH